MRLFDLVVDILKLLLTSTRPLSFVFVFPLCVELVLLRDFPPPDMMRYIYIYILLLIVGTAL